MTPGPWIVRNEYLPAEDRDTTCLYGRRQWIHAIGQPWVEEYIGELDRDEKSPDALAIAALPDCIAALKDMVEMLAMDTLEDGWLVQDAYLETFTAARAALAKAGVS